ncbi:Asp23/Gls24 family envelope stress response protein [Plantibacter flavus]|uniref:Asp23/Gls24 family envelope stress response protein n=1 Tax=Plantibacter flavus TaxID=150123 RepID=UPI003F160A80
MSDDIQHPDDHHIPTPADVRAKHPTALVPAHQNDDEVRTIESHDGESIARPSSASQQDHLAERIAETASTIPGVHGLGSAPARVIDSARTRLLGRTAVPGVSVLVEGATTSVEVDLVAEYPANVTELADTVRAAVGHTLDDQPGGRIAVDVTVSDVHGPFDPPEPDPAAAIDAGSDSPAAGTTDSSPQQTEPDASVAAQDAEPSVGSDQPGSQP